MLDKKVSDLTVTELKSLLREVMEETLTDMLADPNGSSELTEGVKDILRRSLKKMKDGDLYDVADVARRLGLGDVTP